MQTKYKREKAQEPLVVLFGGGCLQFPRPCFPLSGPTPPNQINFKSVGLAVDKKSSLNAGGAFKAYKTNETFLSPRSDIETYAEWDLQFPICVKYRMLT